MLTFKNEDARSVVKQSLGDQAAAEVEGLDFLPFPELNRAVFDDVQFLKSQKAIPEHIKISGWVYEVENGNVRQVV